MRTEQEIKDKIIEIENIVKERADKLTDGEKEYLVFRRSALIWVLNE